MLVLLALFGPAIIIGVGVTVLFRRHPGLDPGSSRQTRRVAKLVDRELRAHERLASFVRDRLNPAEVTGLAMTLALAAVVVVGTLAYWVRTTTVVVEFDQSVATWAGDHATDITDSILDWVTQIGGTIGVIIIATVVGVFELTRTRSRWVIPFLVLVLAGQSVASNLIKAGVDRFRPAIDPVIGLSHDSFPSGHSSGTAATLAACAFLLCRRRAPSVQGALTGAAVGIAVIVAASRVLLTVHWFSDVVAGLMLGWGWFGVCAVAFGGRLLVFGAPVELGERVAAHDP